MPHPRFSSQEIRQRGQELYQQRIRGEVETEANTGKLVSIDIETGDYEVGDDLLQIGDGLLARHPGAALYGIRIGYDAVYAIGSTLARTTLPTLTSPSGLSISGVERSGRCASSSPGRWTVLAGSINPELALSPQ